MTNPVIDKIGNQYWRNERGQYHRENGPAFIHIDGLQSFWFNGKIHRIDGPAAIWADGYQEWHVNDRRYFDNKTFQETAGISDEDMTAIVLKYGNVK
jgi:hypothetical protein